MELGPDIAGETGEAEPRHGAARDDRRRPASGAGGVDPDDPHLASLARLMPVLYLFGIASSAILAVSFHDHAPLPFLLIPSLLLSGVCVAGLIAWRRGPASEQAARLPARATAFSLACSGWATILFPHGDGFARTQAALIVLAMIVTAMSCLGRVRRAALFGGAAAGATMAAFLFLEGGRASTTMGAYLLVVIVAIVFAAEAQGRAFQRNSETLALAAAARRRSESLADENIRLANVDLLTGLPNRRAFFARLDEAFAAAQATRTSLVVGIIDLDGFKPVNDLHGLGMGDRLLAEVGQRLAGLARPLDFFAARLGGDEFALIRLGPADDATLLGLGDMICEVLSAPYAFHDTAIQISASAGLAAYPALAANPEQLFERADHALHDSKTAHRGSASLFSAGHEARLNDNALIEQTLKTADLEAELVVEFQPIVETRSNRVLGFEALARWDSAVLGRVPPARFIPVAERAGFIGQLTRPLLRKALAAARTWPGEPRLSFNLSAHDLNAPEGISALIAIIEHGGFDPRRLDLEITETAFARDFDQVRRSTEMLRRLGCGISLDDFGTGYSSLSRLHELPLTKLKIDRSFVSDLDRSPASHKIIKLLLALCQDMGLECVIEGVETRREMALLEKLGGRVVQGYYYSPPIPEADVPDYLRRQGRGPGLGGEDGRMRLAG